MKQHYNIYKVNYGPNWEVLPNATLIATVIGIEPAAQVCKILNAENVQEIETQYFYIKAQ